MANIITPTILSSRHLLVLWSLSPNTAFVPNFHEDCHYHLKSPTGKMLRNTRSFLLPSSLGESGNSQCLLA